MLGGLREKVREAKSKNPEVSEAELALVQSRVHPSDSQLRSIPVSGCSVPGWGPGTASPWKTRNRIGGDTHTTVEGLRAVFRNLP